MKKDKIGKHEFARLVAERSGCSIKTVLSVLESAGNVVATTVKGGTEIGILGGTFYRRDAAPKLGVKPGTSERVMYPGKSSVAFRSGEALKAALK